MAPGLQVPDDLGTLGVVELHADLDKGLLAGELVQERQGRFPAGKVTGDDDVFSHVVPPIYLWPAPMISDRLSMPYCSMTWGSASTIFLLA